MPKPNRITDNDVTLETQMESIAWDQLLVELQREAMGSPCVCPKCGVSHSHASKERKEAWTRWLIEAAHLHA